MRHDPKIQPNPSALTAQCAGLFLAHLSDRDASGLPVLEGIGAAMSLDPVPEGDLGRWLAVCKRAQMDGRVVVLGFVPLEEAVLAVGQACKTRDVVIGTDKAQIRLTPDGRVRITGEDVRLDARGTMRLGGATIDLN